MRRRRSLLVAVAVVVVLLVLGGVLAAVRGGGDAPVRQEALSVPVGPEADGTPVRLDAELYLPERTPAPAVLLAHGFGGSKESEASDALDLARHGYVVLTWSARGFGRSGGLIHVDSPDYEVADARALVDLLAKRPEVQQDGPGDPRVGAAGASYGGALSLLLAGTDRRVDAVAPSITWNDLAQSLFPQYALAEATRQTPAGVQPTSTPGVFKRSWAGIFFGSGSAPVLGGSTGRSATATPCGRFAPDVCAAYEASASTGRPTQQILDLLRRSSPASVAHRITAPTLLVQGEADTLFPLGQADATARALQVNGTVVREVWYSGGHDDPSAEGDRVRTLVRDWFDTDLRGTDGRSSGRAPAQPAFEVTVPSAVLSSQDSSAAPEVRSAPELPGATGGGPVPTTSLEPAGPAQTIVSPAGGNPAAVSSLPGLGSALGALGGTGAIGRLSVVPGQSAVFQTPPLDRALTVTGSSTVLLHVTSSTSDATLFASLHDVSSDGSSDVLPQGIVAPLHLQDVPRGGVDVQVALPAIVREVAAGHRLRLVVSSTDTAYALPTDPRTYQVSLGDGGLTVPTVATTPVSGSGSTGPLVAAIVMAALLLLLSVALLVVKRRRSGSAQDPELADVPLAVRGLGKAYGDGFRAVSDLSFQVERGQVLGLLGPNGAGKTTTLRMLMGLIRPSEGEILVFGHRIRPGAPVLSRVGAFVEGAGFLPHLNGRDNLELYWRATGRPLEDAQLDAALEVAGLGDDVQRRVKTYSQGMRQRLAIAQAMLGLPDLLVLDEPTNGLDPPQIREMREVLQRYAATGRTVVVSSHLLSEVEQTCTDVVVMHQGRLVAQGPVAEVAGSATSVVVDVDDAARAAEVAALVPGVRDVQASSNGHGQLVLRLVGTPRAELVRALVEAGLQVDRVAPQRGLEEAFLTLVGEGS
ncbi:MAG: alpha/beta fold hydrolase [Motilibacteraceae bacterium]